MNNRSYLLFALIFLIAFQLKAGGNERPNIVLILSDDQAWTDYGFMGHPEIETPNLDKLAEHSLVFERGYLAAPICRPSLATIVTGLFPSQHGVTGNDVNGKIERAKNDIPLRESFHEHPSFIKDLVASGYLAHQSGKWWEGSWQDGGFTHGMTHGDPERKGRHGDEGLKIGREGIKEVTDFIDYTIEKDKPFFVWYAPFLPHTPHNPPERLHKKYAQPDRPKDLSKYYAMCDWFDEGCGELLDYLEAKDLTDNTLVIYICDNGWATYSSNAQDPNQKNWKSFALRSKTSPYENGVRTPIMISWPGHVMPGRVRDFAHSIDIFPTIASAADLEVPETLSGIDLLDVQAYLSRQIVFGEVHSTHNISIGNPEETIQYRWCIKGKWKFILRYNGKDTTKYIASHNWDTAPYRLYNLAKDPHEKNDVARQHPRIVAKMKRAIHDWAGEITSQAKVDINEVKGL